MEDHLIEKNNGLNGMSAYDGGSLDLVETEDQGSMGTNAFITPLAQYTPHDGHLGLRRRRRTNVSYSEDDHQHQETHIQNDDHHFRYLILTLPTKTPSPPKFHNISKFLDYVSVGGHWVDRLFHDLKLKIETQLFEEPHDGHFGLLLGRIKLFLHSADYYFWNPELGDKDYEFIESWNRLIELGDRDNEFIESWNRLIKSREIRNEFIDLWNRKIWKPLIKLGEGEDEVYQMIYPPAVIAAAGTEILSEDDFSDSSLDLGEGVDVDSQMISPPTVIAAAGTDSILNLGTASFVTAGPRHTEMDFEWIFVITNIVLESMSAIFTQLSSKQKPQYALFGMLLSYSALLTCMIELIYEGRRHHQQIPIGRTRSGTWYYYDPPPRCKSFATLNKIVALACALGQCVVTTINYRFQNPIKLTISPIILAFGVLFSKILKYHQRESTLISFMKSL